MTYRLGLNKYADWTREERRALASGLRKVNRTSNFNVSELRDDYPDSVDWRLRGAVTPVQD